MYFQNNGLLNFSRLFSLLHKYDRTVSINDLKYSRQAHIKSKEVELKDEVDLWSRLKMAAN